MIYLLSVLTGIFEKYAFYKGSKNTHNIVAIFAATSLLNFFIFLIMYKHFPTFNFALNIFRYGITFENVSFYILVLFENLMVYLTLRNFKVQKTYAEVSFVLINTIWGVSLAALIFSALFNLKIKPYMSPAQTFFFFLAVFFLSLFYFYGKKINNKPLLILYAFFMSILAFISLYTLKYYNKEGFIIYSVIYMTIAFQYLIKNRFKFKLKGISFKSVLAYNSIIFIVLFVLKTLPVAAYILLKRVGQFSMGNILDGSFFEIKNLTTVILLILIFIVFFC